MRVIVIGAGVVGYNVALMLSREQHDVIVIEQSAEKVDKIRQKLDVMTIKGSGADPAVLLEAGASHADLVVAATDVDEINMVACIAAKRLGSRRTMARLRKDEYASGSSCAGLGIDHAVTPEVIAAEEIADLLTSGSAIAIEDFGARKIKMAAYRVGESPITGVPLREVRFPKPCKVVAIVRPEETVVPHGDDFISPGDHVYVVAHREDIPDLEPLFGMASGMGAPRHITIFGGGRIGGRLAGILERNRLGVKVFEQNRERCDVLAAELEHARVVCGDERDLDLFREEAMAGADAFVAVTARGELNIIMALLAKQMGVARTIAVFDQPEYVPLGERFGIDAAISPLLLSAGAILKFVRRGQVLSVALLEKQQAEAIELVASSDSRIVGRPLKDVGFPRGAIVGAVLRDGKAFVPDGNTRISAGDRVVIVTLPSTTPVVERLFGKTGALAMGGSPWRAASPASFPDPPGQLARGETRHPASAESAQRQGASGPTWF